MTPHSQRHKKKILQFCLALKIAVRIHTPNDDRLFPGRMDTQIGEGPDSEDEWAVEKIQSHAGSGEDSIFEILWKTGDITWMPYYQIKHLQALETYLELMGVESASKLVTGKGKPPREDPQIFLGGISFYSPFLSPYQPSSLPIPSKPTGHSLITPFLFQILDLKAKSNSPNPSLLFSLIPSTIVNLVHPPSTTRNLLISFVVMSKNIRHPSFTRRNQTEYVMNNPDAERKSILHVGQIEHYLAFDKLLRESLHHTLSKIQEEPIGYWAFADTLMWS